MREGLARFESGLAAHRALAEGSAPRNVALQWFKREMNLLPPAPASVSTGPLGLSWFHFYSMLVLVAFAVVMIWMYFHKMRRASALLEALASATPSSGNDPAFATECYGPTGQQPVPVPAIGRRRGRCREHRRRPGRLLRHNGGGVSVRRHCH